jgi:hypothetical protein
MAGVEHPNPEEIHEHGQDRFSRRVALVTAVYVVMLALAALGGDHAMKELVLAQQKSSDQWAVNGFLLLVEIPYIVGGH